MKSMMNCSYNSLVERMKRIVFLRDLFGDIQRFVPKRITLCVSSESSFSCQENPRQKITWH